jgi:hypothetical protein
LGCSAAVTGVVWLRAAYCHTTTSSMPQDEKCCLVDKEGGKKTTLTVLFS